MAPTKKYNVKTANRYTPLVNQMKKMVGKTVHRSKIPFKNGNFDFLIKFKYITRVKTGYYLVSASVKDLDGKSLAALLRNARREYKEKYKKPVATPGRSAPKKKRKYTRRATQPTKPIDAGDSARIDQLVDAAVNQSSDITEINQRLTNIESLLFRMVSER